MSASSSLSTDPKYARFVSGLKAIASLEAIHLMDRWDHREGKWYAWHAPTWVLEDIGAADTPPGLALVDWTMNAGAPDWQLVESWVPDLYSRVNAAYESHKRRWPELRLVWGPWGGGDWRYAWDSTAPPPPRPPKPEPPWRIPGTLPPHCVVRIEAVQDAVRRGFMVHDTAQRYIDQIVAECT